MGRDGLYEDVPRGITGGGGGGGGAVAGIMGMIGGSLDGGSTGCGAHFGGRGFMFNEPFKFGNSSRFALATASSCGRIAMAC